MAYANLPDAWEQAIGGWLIWLGAHGRPATTRRLRRGQVRVVAKRSGTTHPDEITEHDLVRLSATSDWSNDYRKGVRSALIDFYAFCVREGITESNPAEALPTVSGSPPRPRPATDAVWHALLDKADPRERIMALLACEAGMRRAEVACCHTDDLIEGREGATLIVHGKGNKQRAVPITDFLAREILAFCPTGGYLFPGQIDGHLSAQYVGKLISDLMPAGWTMHKLRHRFASRSYDGTGNLRAVQEVLGHASVATTQRYTAVGARDLRAVVEAAHARNNSSRYVLVEDIAQRPSIVPPPPADVPTDPIIA